MRMNDEDILSDYERQRLERMRENAAVMESLGLSDAIFDINGSYNQHGARVGRRRRRNNNIDIRDNDDNDDDDDYHGNNSVGRMRSSSRNVPSVPTRQMPSRAAKLGDKRYFVPGEEDILDYES